MADTWERQEFETAKAYAAFCYYRDLGLDRSLDRVVQGWCNGGNRSRIIKWSSDWNWVARCRAYDAKLELAARRTREKELEAEHRRQIEDFGERQKKAAQALFGVAMKALVKLSNRLDHIPDQDLKVGDIRAIAAAIAEARDSEATHLALPELLDEDRRAVSPEDSEDFCEPDSAGQA